jgi:hypothetical protein
MDKIVEVRSLSICSLLVLSMIIRTGPWIITSCMLVAGIYPEWISEDRRRSSLSPSQSDWQTSQHINAGLFQEFSL